MSRLKNHKHRKPDILLVLVTVVALAFAATLTVHVHALSAEGTTSNQTLLSLSLF